MQKILHRNRSGIPDEEWRLSAFVRDLMYSEFTLHRWSGEDRSGQSLAVAWFANAYGQLLDAYEITEE